MSDKVLFYQNCEIAIFTRFYLIIFLLSNIDTFFVFATRCKCAPFTLHCATYYLLATHHPLHLGRPTQVRSHRQKLSLDYYEQFHLIPASAQPAPYTMHTNPLQTTVHTTQSAVRADHCLWYRGVKTHNTRQTRQCNV